MNCLPPSRKKARFEPPYLPLDILAPDPFPFPTTFHVGYGYMYFLELCNKYSWAFDSVIFFTLASLNKIWATFNLMFLWCFQGLCRTCSHCLCRDVPIITKSLGIYKRRLVIFTPYSPCHFWWLVVRCSKSKVLTNVANSFESNCDPLILTGQVFQSGQSGFFSFRIVILPLVSGNLTILQRLL